MRALDIIRESLRTHEDWLAFFVKYPAKQDMEEYKRLGGIEEQRARVKDYKAAVIEIEKLKSFVEWIKSDSYDSRNLSMFANEALPPLPKGAKP